MFKKIADKQKILEIYPTHKNKNVTHIQRNPKAKKTDILVRDICKERSSKYIEIPIVTLLGIMKRKFFCEKRNHTDHLSPASVRV